MFYQEKIGNPEANIIIDIAHTLLYFESEAPILTKS
jgi:hypothetical protein